MHRRGAISPTTTRERAGGGCSLSHSCEPRLCCRAPRNRMPRLIRLRPTHGRREAWSTALIGTAASVSTAREGLEMCEPHCTHWVGVGGVL